MARRTVDVSAAAEFVWRSARLIDRLRFACFFSNGSRDAVVAAVRAYRNDDGASGDPAAGAAGEAVSAASAGRGTRGRRPSGLAGG